MSLRKFHAEMGGPQHSGERLNWPGTLDGFPVIGSQGAMANLKQEELESLELRYDYRSKMFLLWEPEAKTEFDDINDKIVNGWYRLLKRADVYDEENKHYRVWLEWAQVYGMIPPKATP